ncbi:MAG: hypothetical protein JSR32_07065 [Proteobacteria bacterium]|nr:hypothetical protein [Pseudomonadota bacterium]
MSPLWRDRIQIFLAPGQIDWIRSARGFKPVQAAKVTVLCEPMQGAPLWRAALQQLEKHLTEVSNTELTITLSNHFVRYVTLPPQAEIMTPEEVNAYAAFRMREIYAERVDAWVLSVSEWNPLTGAVCAAIPRDLLTELEKMAARLQCKLKEIEPYFASVYDHWQKLLDSEKTYCAVVETGRMCISTQIGGVWYSIRNQRIVHSVADELLAALDQEAVLSGNKAALEQVFLFAPQHPDLTLPENCGWLTVPLPAEKIPAPAHYPSAQIGDSRLNHAALEA